MAEINDATAVRPALHSIGLPLIPSQDAANFFARLQDGGGAVELPYMPYVAPKLAESPWARQTVEFERAGETDAARPKAYVVRKPFPSFAHAVLAQMRFIVTGELTREWSSSGGVGAQRANLADFVLADLADYASGRNWITTKQETAARLLEAQAAELQ